MGKNHRHKKKLKSEKAKVHIKSKTKFLPKGQNVTDTSFKIKQIIVQEQLKEKDQSLLLSKRKLSVTELVTKLKHYNETVKVEACQELKDMIKKHSVEIIQTYLSLIIQSLSALIQDRERKVRRACVGVFNEIFENVSNSKLEVFFNYILINLKCAMTNIDKNIQEDSLLLLDALLEHKSSLIGDNFEKIFPDFLTLISKLRSQAAPDRTLTLNLGSKLTSVKWRIKVLSRLYRILDIMMQRGHNKNKMNYNDNVKPVDQKASESNCIPIYKDIRHYEICSINLFGNNIKNEQPVLNKQITVLIPLLYETWLEVVPEKSSKKNVSEATTLTEESAAVFSCVINILCLLYEYCHLNNTDNIFSYTETATFLDHLVSNFPYYQRKTKNSEFAKDFSKLFKLNNDTHCVAENLIIIYLFIKFKINVNKENTKHKLNFITQYLNNCLESHNRLTSSNITYFVKILDEILLKNPKLWHRFGVNNVEIMENLISFYDERSMPQSCKNEILKILTSNCQYRYEKQQEWLGNLPNLLCKEQVSAKLINVILNLCKQNHKPTQQAMKNLLNNILDNLPVMKINETINQESAEQNICYIFFYVPVFGEDIKNIKNFIESHENSNYSRYFRNVLDFKLNMFK